MSLSSSMMLSRMLSNSATKSIFDSDDVSNAAVASGSLTGDLGSQGDGLAVRLLIFCGEAKLSSIGDDPNKY